MFFRSTVSEKVYSESLHRYLFFTIVSHYMSFKTVSVKESLGPLATLICLFTSMSTYDFLRSKVLEKVLSHWLHWYGISPVWIIICVIRLLAWENAFSQWVHWHGFSLVLVLICILCVLALPHWLHWCGSSPVSHHMYFKTTSMRESLSTLTTLMCFIH